MAIYYYIKAQDNIVEEYIPNLNKVSRITICCHFEDYPKHKHESSGFVELMTLIPESKYLNTKYMRSSRQHFERIELKRNEVIVVGKKKYIKKFEKKHNTAIWKEYIKCH